MHKQPSPAPAPAPPHAAPPVDRSVDINWKQGMINISINCAPTCSSSATRRSSCAFAACVSISAWVTWSTCRQGGAQQPATPENEGECVGSLCRLRLRALGHLSTCKTEAGNGHPVRIASELNVFSQTPALLL